LHCLPESTILCTAENIVTENDVLLVVLYTSY
jgi:hypothetical protein